MVLVGAFCLYTVRNTNRTKMFSLRPWILSSSRLRQRPFSSRIECWLASKSREVGSQAHGGCCRPMGHLPLTATRVWRSCWPGPLQGLYWELFSFLGKTNQPPVRKPRSGQIFLEKNPFCLLPPVVAFCLRLWKLRPLNGLLLWGASQLWILQELTQEAYACPIKGKGGNLDTPFFLKFIFNWIIIDIRYDASFRYAT